jgi:arylsulfatase A-like enzyme
MSGIQRTRREFMRSAGVAAAGLTLSSRCRAAEPSGRRPNVLILLSDDQRFDTIGALNNPAIRTPNMDRLVCRGVAFTHAHTMGAMCGALCVPSRAMLMTGRTLFHLRGDGHVIPPRDVTLPEMLRKQGYVTFGTGKWHNDPASYARSFSQGGTIFFGGMTDQSAVPVQDFDPSGQYRRERQRIERRPSSELFSDTAIGFLRRHKGDEPFCLYVAYTSPHDPRTAPKEFADLYSPDRMELPKNFLPRHPFDNGELRVRDELLAPFPRTPEVIRRHLADYYAMISHLDSQIGRVLTALDESGHGDDTIIVFAGDNGLAVGQHGLMGKQNLYDHSARVPLIVGGPGVPRGRSCDALVYLADVCPTLCELTGASVPASVEAKSLRPLLKEPTARFRDSLCCAYMTFQRSIRADDWKLILYNVKGRQTPQLFNLKDDRWETRSLAEDPGQADRVRMLTGSLRAWMKAMDDPCDLSRPNWGVPSGT